MVRRDHAYLLTEFSGEVIRYSIGSDGTLAEAQRTFVVDPASGLNHSRYGAKPMDEHLIWGADLHLASQYLFTSERTTSTITATRVGDDGSLGDVVSHTPVELQPRGFAVTSDGAYLISVGERSTHPTLFGISPDGALTELGRVEIGAGANWVRVI